jgi:xylan 1,4-beta-xylosidase
MTAEAYLMDASHSNAYAVWQRMGSPQKPSAAQQQELVQAGKLEQVTAAHPMAVKDGAARVQMMLARQGVALVRLNWD